MADQKDIRDLPSPLGPHFESPECIFGDISWKIHKKIRFLLYFTALYLHEFFIKHHKIAFSDKWCLGGPHQFLRNFDRNFGLTSISATIAKMRFFILKKSNIFVIVAEIYVRNFCRNFWENDGNLLGPNCLYTRFHDASWKIREDTVSILK